jgi:hypothetical protein
MKPKLRGSDTAKARISSRTKAELAREITQAVSTIKRSKPSRSRYEKRQPHGQSTSAVVARDDTLEDARESWRRIEAHQDPLAVRKANAHSAAESPAEPTPERRAKALEIGRALVGRREVRRLKTTLDLLDDHGHLPKHLRIAFDKFCEAIAIAMNVSAIDERTSSSARLISGYSDAPVKAYGPREISDRVLDARYLWKMLERELPLEVREIVEQLVGEETGLLQGRPQSLQKYGREYRWHQDKQAGSAGAMMAIMACAVLYHALKRGVGRRAVNPPDCDNGAK